MFILEFFQAQVSLGHPAKTNWEDSVKITVSLGKDHTHNASWSQAPGTNKFMPSPHPSHVTHDIMFVMVLLRLL